MTVTLTCYRRNVIIILDILCFWNTVHEFLEININKLSSAICVSVFMPPCGKMQKLYVK